MSLRKLVFATATIALSGTLHAAAVGHLALSRGPMPDLSAGGEQAIPLLGDSFADMAAGGAVAPVAPTLSPKAAATPLAPLEVSAMEMQPVVAVARPIKPAKTPQPVAPEVATAPAPQYATKSETHATITPVPNAVPVRPEPRSQKSKPAPKAKPQAVGNSDQNRTKGGASGQVAGKSAVAKGKAADQQGDGGKAAASYASSVLRKISGTRKAKSPAKGRVVVSFSVSGNGTLQSASIAKSSGDARLDQVALDHIRRAAPFPAPPPSAKRNFAFEFIGKN